MSLLCSYTHFGFGLRPRTKHLQTRSAYIDPLPRFTFLSFQRHQSSITYAPQSFVSQFGLAIPDALSIQVYPPTSTVYTWITYYMTCFGWWTCHIIPCAGNVALPNEPCDDVELYNNIGWLTKRYIWLGFPEDSCCSRQLACVQLIYLHAFDIMA